MARTARGAKPPKVVVDRPGAVAAYERIFPGDRSTVKCLMPGCDQYVPDIPEHLRKAHSKTELTEYIAEFNGAPLYGEKPEEIESDDPRLAVSAREAAAHPGGRDGALVEKTLPPGDRRFYRQSVASLIDKGYPADYRVSSLAYYQMLVARTRNDLESKRLAAGGSVLPGESFELLKTLESSVGNLYRDLEKERLSRDNGVNPIDIINGTLAEAEIWVRDNQGELVMGCPNCNAPLHPPGIPYWCFAPMRTRVGLEWVVWSAELWSLVTAGQIRLWQMAFALRTSPEGLKMIAQRRGEQWPETLDLSSEEQLLRVELDRQDLEVMYQGAARTPIKEIERVEKAAAEEVAADESAEPIVAVGSDDDDLPPVDRL